MCVIAVVPKGTKFPTFSQLHAMWQSNPHGAGFMWPGRDPAANGTLALKIQKGLMTFEQLKRALKKHRAEFLDDHNVATADFAVHFRIASAGGVSVNLTHPFQAGVDVGLMHNGHIAELAYKDPTKPEEGKLVTASQPVSRAQQQVLGCLRDEDSATDIDSEDMFELLLDRAVAHGILTPAEACDRVNAYQEPRHGDPFVAAGRLILRKLDAMTDEEKQGIPPLVDILGLTPEQLKSRPRHPGKHMRPSASTASAIMPPVPTESDTSRLATILARLPRGWQRNDVCAYMIQEAFLGWDRIVLFDSKGLARIIGEKKGTWHETSAESKGFWTSNDHWVTKKQVSGQELVSKSASTSTTPTWSGSTRWPSTKVIDVTKSQTQADDHEEWRNLPDDIPPGFSEDGDDENLPGASFDASVS